MSMPRDNHKPLGRVQDRLIDQLVDNELPAAERRVLLTQLDTEPDGWRRCALAFLEAQSWRETFGALTAPASDAARPEVVPIGPARRPNRRRRFAALTTLAASLVAAFALGWAAHSGPGEPAPDAPLVGETSPPAVPSPTPRPTPVEVAANEAPPSEVEEPPALLDPVVREWEQRGYRAERQKRVLSVELNDGRRLDVPVDEVRLQYVGDRTY